MVILGGILRKIITSLDVKTLIMNFRHRIRITESLPIVFRFIYQPPGRTLLTIRSLFLVLVPNRDFSGKLG